MVPVKSAAVDACSRYPSALTEDGLRDLEDGVQKLTDRFVKSVDDHLERKETEIMKV